MKGDDDILINPFRLEELMDTAERTEPRIYGCTLGGQPVERAEHSRYADFKWNKGTYPKYVSGGGFLVNWAAALALQNQIPKTPIISIDDAYIGIAMELAGYGGDDYIKRDLKFLSWGYRSERKKYNVCEIDKIVYFHKFTNTQLDCFWNSFIQYRDLCQLDRNKTDEERRNLERGIKCKFVSILF